MSFVLYKDDQEIGEVSGWGFIPGKEQYEDAMGEKVLVGKDSDRCVFDSPRMIAGAPGSNYYLVFEGTTKFNIQIERVQNYRVQAIVNSKEPYSPPSTDSEDGENSGS